MTVRDPRSSSVILVTAALVVALGVGVYLVFFRPDSSGLPGAGTPAYTEASRAFQRGLAGLEVGLLDAAIDDFARATEAAPGEPAIWANLGLAHLRLGAFDAAAPAVARAAELAPGSAHVAFLQARLESSRGNRDQAIAHLRRAVALDAADARVRTALIEEIENAAGPGADDEAQQLLEAVVEQRATNLALLVERARLAAKRGDEALLRESLTRIEPFVADWPVEVADQFRAAERAASDAPADAVLELAFLRNVLAQVPAFLESRRQVTASAELIAEPVAQFLRLPVTQNTPATPDLALSYAVEPVDDSAGDGWQVLLAMSPDGVAPPALFVAGGGGIVRVGGEAAMALPVPAGQVMAGLGRHGLAAVDWNHDFKQDLVAAGSRGVALFLQDETGQFADATAAAAASGAAVDTPATGAWAVDIEMDGDLDLLVGMAGAESVLLRNTGTGVWEREVIFPGVVDVRAFAWGDVDRDGDSDVVLVDGTGRLLVYANLQAGAFQRIEPPAGSTAIHDLTLADVDADGRLDLVTLDGTGVIRRSTLGVEGWVEAEWLRAAAAGDGRLFVADLDNNGALDLVVSSDAESAAWLADAGQMLTPIDLPGGTRLAAVVDLNADGLLDMAGLAEGRPVRLAARAAQDYHYQVVRPRAQTSAGDQRINTFGIGGLVEVRAGTLVQQQLISSPVVHVGLGNNADVDVTRIVWPNGVPQAEFDPAVDTAITAEQRLKGSCPWIFADDGSGLQFVTDFLWRSPLGLRINAQDTAGVTQTEDWVRIRGHQLAARGGQYDIRISAELWETHFVDHVSLMVVDHPAGTEIFVDERFVPGAMPSLKVHATRQPVPVTNATDHRGVDVTNVVAREDGRYLDTFERGPYQGIAEDHWVEFDAATPITADAPAWIVARGWIYPTDSSINVAIGQGGRIVPSSLALEALDRSGRWIPVATDLGFPAGKEKTVLIDLRPVARAGLAGARLRLRTNLEIYWDTLATAVGVGDAPLRTTRLNPSVADLRYRGYSVTNADQRNRPEVPTYDRIANVVPRWRDLRGFYTRFGDVRELLATVEDRYVIMNAGDELRLAFDAPAEAGNGWVRDFVLIGDGWVKDGDYNTSYSKTVLPLPAHGQTEYEAASAEPTLADDPVYRRHADDWTTFHTRYVAPDTFVAGLRREARTGAP